MPDIDFVIAWVEGNDPAHVAARRRFADSSRNVHSSASHETRFASSGEIYYLIASILAYAPFVRRVRIVTDNQKPALLDSFAEAGLCAPDFLEIVSHDVIFDGLDAVRPTFNPRPIESALWRIPGLAEQFVYANDDMFLNAPVTPEAFFRDGRPVLYGSLVRPGSHRLTTRLRAPLSALLGSGKRRPSHRISQELGASLAGMMSNFFYTEHHPHPLRRSMLERFHAENAEVLRRQVQYRFRHVEQYNSVALSNNLEMLAGNPPVEPPADVAYMRPGKKRPLPQSELERIRRAETAFACIQSLDRFSASMQAEIHATLCKKFERTLPSIVIASNRVTG